MARAFYFYSSWIAFAQKIISSNDFQISTSLIFLSILTAKFCYCHFRFFFSFSIILHLLSKIVRINFQFHFLLKNRLFPLKTESAVFAVDFHKI